MPDTGFVFPGTAVNDPGPDVDWINPGNATADDGNFAHYPADTDWLHCQNFDFSSIPGGATIDGVEVKIGDFSLLGDGTKEFNGLVLLDETGTRGATSRHTEISVINTTVKTEIAGSDTDLWGQPLTNDIVQDVDFGVAARVRVIGGLIVNPFLDYIQMKVYYTGPPPQESWAMNTVRCSRKTKG
jgi:hypothetical protein